MTYSNGGGGAATAAAAYESSVYWTDFVFFVLIDYVQFELCVCARAGVWV